MRVVFMGTPQFSVPTLEAVHRAGHEIVAVCTAPDRRAGRGRRPRASAVKEVAMRLGFPILQPKTLRRPELWGQVADHEPDSIVVVSYGLILPTELLRMPRLGCVNLHPSRLPRHRGATPIPAAILAGDQTTGVTVFLMNERVDAGDILGQRTVLIADDDTSESLGRRLAVIGSELVIDVLDRQQRGEIWPVPQNVDGATFTRRLEKSDGLIDWSQTAERICRMVRAYHGWPGAFSSWSGKSIKLVEAKTVGSFGLAPGEVAIGPEADVLLIGTGDGQLAVERLQMEGRREMAAADFVRGNRSIAGQRLG